MDGRQPRHKHIQVTLTGVAAQVWEFPQEPEEIRIWVQPVGLCSFYESVHNSAGLRTLHGIGEQPVFSSNSKGADGVLGKIIGNIRLAVIEERGEVWLLVMSICHRLGQLAAGNRVQCFQPQPISLKQRIHLHLTRCFPHTIAYFGEFLL